MKNDRLAASRKDAHIDLALSSHGRSRVENSFDRLRFVHCALPEIDLNDVNLTTQFLDKSLSAPLMIGAMTGGTPRAEMINQSLAEVAQEEKIGFAVGSQRAALELGQNAKNLRKLAPNIPIIGNLGGIQLAREKGIELAKRAIESLNADAIAIHLNPLQEAVQPEGERDWHGVLFAIENLVKENFCPVIVKEVGAGINVQVARQLFDSGVYAIDVAGSGGTNWAGIESARRNEGAKIYDPFMDWGITTLDCLIGLRGEPGTKRLIASGGLRNGLDAMRAFWLGADIMSFAGLMLKSLITQDGSLNKKSLKGFIMDLRAQMSLTMFLTGADTLGSFRTKEAQLDGKKF